MTEHIVTSYDDELKALAIMITRMGGHAEKVLTDATQALNRHDEELAMRTINADEEIDRLEHEIEELAILMIAKRQPMAADLREVIAAIKISSDLERIGDLAKNIAKRAVAIQSETGAVKAALGIDRMSRIASRQLKDVLDSYTQRDVDKAMDVWHRDSELDAMYTSIFRELLTYMMEDTRNITFSTHLLFAAKNIERIGDHATNIAETIYYLSTGAPLREARPKKDASSFTPADYPQTDD
ncbi:phosphate signaling complex protein PhoU [Microbaculum marinum]|uniref:Phosphate-specific transport system accessory protein PhoU n=1 Tax=Microbaculum marinum TaxID=1764581 RepID=A0AAW9RBS8_9HYPH